MWGDGEVCCREDGRGGGGVGKGEGGGDAYTQ